MSSGLFPTSPAIKKLLLEAMGDVQALNDTSGDLVADLRNFVELDEFQMKRQFRMLLGV